MCDLAVNFRPQYLALTLLLLVGFALGKKKKELLFSGLVALLNLACLIPFYLPSGQPPPGGLQLRVVQINVSTHNSNFAAVTSFLAAAKPDLVVVEEIDDRWIEGLAKLREAFPHHIEQPEEGNFGIGLYSRWPLGLVDILHLGKAELTTLCAQVRVDGREITVIGAHPFPPASQANWALRNEQLTELAGHVQTLKGDVLLLGDLNVTPWSPYFRDLTRATGLRDARRGRGLKLSWPTALPMLRIPIDYCLVSRGFAVRAVRLGPKTGSDHFPLMADLALP